VPADSGLSFLAPAFLGLAALAVLVVVLHQQHGRRIVEVPSLLIWQRLQARAEQTALSRSLPRPNLLLLLQIAVVLLTALALARPLFGAGAGTPQHQIYVLDGSGSMRASDGSATRFDEARARLAEMLRGAVDPNGPRISLVLADSTPELLLARQADDHDLLATLPGIAVTDSTADWRSVGRLVDSVRRPGEATQVVVLTDAADGGVTEALAQPAGVTLSTVRIGAPVPNAGLVASLAAVPGDKANQFKLSGKVAFAGGQSAATVTVDVNSLDATLPLQLASESFKAPTGWAAGASPTTPFAIDLTLPGAGVVTAHLGDDGLVGDNAARFVVDAAPPARNVVLVGPADPALLRGSQALDGVKVTQADALPADLSGVDLAVIDDVAVDRVPETNTLWVGRARVTGEADPPGVVPGDVTAWRADHPLSRGIVWSSVALTAASKLTPWPDATPILEAGDMPLIEARSTAHGREVRLAFDPAKDWADDTSFPQFLDNLLGWLGPAADGRIRPACTVGLPCALDARWSGTVSLLDGDRLDAAPVVQVALPPAGGVFVPERAGIYRHGADLLAVNASGDEEKAVTPRVVAGPDAPTALPVRLWPWLLGAAALLLCLEAWASVARRSAPRWLWATRTVTLLLAGAALLNAPAPSYTDPGRTVVVATSPVPAELAAQLAARPDVGLVTVGDDVQVTADFGGGGVVPAAADGRHDGSTGGALRLAAAMLPADAPGRIVIAGAGAMTAADIADATLRLHDRGIAVDVAAPSPMPAGEVAVTDVAAPPAVLAGDSFQLTGVIRAASAGKAELSVSENGTQITQQNVDLVAGDNPVEVAVPKAKGADTLYRMAVSAPGDTIADNNSDGVHVAAMPAPHILILSADKAAGEAMADGLTKGGLIPKVIVPTGAPWLIEDWLKYDGYMLLDVPALSLNITQQNLLVTAVAQHGRPLLLLGGPHAFGPGGYLQTPLDELSPLSSRVPKPSPQAAVVFVIDRSGSMGQDVGDVDRLEIAKQATLSAIKLLNPQSQVSVVAFDTVPHVVVPLTEASDIDDIAAALSGVGPGGGTEMLSALNAALGQLRGVESPVKHIIALTDGLTSQSDYSSFLQRLSAANVSISTIAIGTDSNDRILRSIAEQGRGVFHGSTDFKALPSILTQETMLLSDSAVEERTTTPEWSGKRSDFLSGLPQSLPPISGYVLTTEKPDAKVDLTIKTEDGGDSPLLASWQYGSGRVLALTTEADGPWTSALDKLPAYGSLWTEVLRHFVSGAEAPGLALHLTRRGDALQMTATALDDKRAPRTRLALTGTVTPIDAAGTPVAGGVPLPISLNESEPGIYDGALALDTPGDYRVVVSDGLRTQAATAHIGYPSRYAFEPGADNAALATATGGRVLASGTALLPPPGDRALAFRPDWIFWALCALAAFTAELLLRYGGSLFYRATQPRRAKNPPAVAAARGGA
jgi:Mg-chelatase subunit ChlD